MKGKIAPVLPRGPEIVFEYNPPEFESSKSVPWAEIGIPGLDFPIQQFVRGGLRTLSLEIYFNEDCYDRAWDVRDSVKKLEALVEKTTQTLAPPVCLFSWGQFQFTCVVGSVSSRYTMFDRQGVPIEATVGLTLREYKDAEVGVSPAAASGGATTGGGAARGPVFSGAAGSGSVFAPPQEGGLAGAQALCTAGAPTVQVAQKGESLQAMAKKAYGNPGLWRALEFANKARGAYDRFRDIKAGAEMMVPDPRFPLAIVERTTAFSSDTVELLRAGQSVQGDGLEKQLRPSVGVLER